MKNIEKMSGEGKTIVGNHNHYALKTDEFIEVMRAVNEGKISYAAAMPYVYNAGVLAGYKCAKIDSKATA